MGHSLFLLVKYTLTFCPFVIWLWHYHFVACKAWKTYTDWCWWHGFSTVSWTWVRLYLYWNICLFWNFRGPKFNYTLCICTFVTRSRALIFYAPASNDLGILFFPVCLFVCVSVCCQRPSDLDFDIEAKNSFLDFIAAGGIVFHKRTLIFFMRLDWMIWGILFLSCLSVCCQL